MDDEQSIGGAGPVNITFKPSTGRMKEQKELPLNSLVLADLTGREDETPLQDRKTIKIDKLNRKEVLASLAPSMEISVKNRLGGEEDELGVQITVKDDDDWTPEGIAKQIPALQQRLQLRAALEAVKAPLGGVKAKAFKKALQAILNDEEKAEKLRAALFTSEDDSGEAAPTEPEAPDETPGD